MNCFNRSRKGGITVFTALALAAMILLNCVLIQGAYVYTARANMKYKLILAGNSLLADYDRILYEQYGLIACREHEDAGAKAAYYFNGSEHGFLDDVLRIGENLRGFHPGDHLQVAPFPGESFGFTADYDGSLDDINQLQREILAIMKYKSPANLLEYLLESLDILDSAEKTGEGERLYKEAGALLEDLSETADKLYRSVEGFSENDFACVNGFDDFLNRPFAIAKIKTDAVLLRGQPFLSLINSKLFNTLESLKSNCVSMKSDYETYAELNRRAISYIREAEAIQKQMKPKIEEIRKWMVSCPADGELETDYREKLEKRVEEMESVLRKTSYASTEKKLEANLSALQEGLTSIDELYEYLTRTDQTVFDDSYVISCIEKAENIHVDTNIRIYTGKGNADESLKEEDPRADSEAAKANVLSDIKDLPAIPQELYETLPSVIRSLSDVDLKEADLLKNALIDDYVLSYFNNGQNSKQAGRYSYLSGEAEYILNGEASDQKNLEYTFLKIFGIRMLLNLVHVVCDQEKMDIARSIGNAIAGALTCGIGGPLYTALIAAAWAMGESALDLKDLKAGKEVPFIKNKTNWKLSIAGIGREAAESAGDAEDEESKKACFAMDYEGYLRILLFLTPQKTKLMRIQDLLELNLTEYSGRRFYLGNYYTGLRLGCNFMVRMPGPVYTVLQEDKSVRGYLLRRDVYVSY